MQHLPLQIRLIDHIKVHDAERAHAGGGAAPWPAGDAGDDRTGVARLHRGLALGQLSDVTIIHVHVDETTQPAIVRKQMALEASVLAGEPFEELAHASSLDLERVPPLDVGAERRGGQNLHRHTVFRSSMVMDSSANAPRSPPSTRLLSSSARPWPTPTIT